MLLQWGERAQMTKSNASAATKTSKTIVKKKTKQLPPHQRLFLLIDGFLNDAKCAQDMFEIVIPALKEQDKKTSEQIDKTMALVERDSKSEGPQRTRVLRHIRTLVANIMKLSRSELMFRGNALVGLVSRYDEFLSALLRNAYRQNPGRATSPDRALTYDEILTLDSLDNVVELFIAKNIDGLLRESHEHQLNIIDNEFKIGIENSFSGYTDFIEIMERRNLLVHAGGKASKYYMKKCKDIGYKLDPDLEEGNVLGVTQEYFSSSILCLSELAIRLGFSIACRIYPSELEDIHDHLLEHVGFPALMDEEWDLSYRIFTFALSWPDKYIPNDHWTRFYVINAALALNHLDKHGEAIGLLDKYDWSTQSSDFLLAVSILRHRWSEAEKIMSEMNGKKPFSEDAFRYWPIFKEFRNTREFRRAYKNIYGKRFVVRLSQEDKDALQKAADSSKA